MITISQLPLVTNVVIQIVPPAVGRTTVRFRGADLWLGTDNTVNSTNGFVIHGGVEQRFELQAGEELWAMPMGVGPLMLFTQV